MEEINTHSLEEFEAYAKGLATEKPSGVFFLNGQLGAGKTTFVQAFAKALGVNSAVRSPTFVIQHEYETTAGKRIYHIDLYRIQNSSELDELKLESLNTENAYVFIEWANRFRPELMQIFATRHKYSINIDVIDENSRNIKIAEL